MRNRLTDGRDYRSAPNNFQATPSVSIVQPHQRRVGEVHSASAICDELGSLTIANPRPQWVKRVGGM